MGDTYFNEWPVPMHQLAQMPRLTSAEHDAIFTLDQAMDAGGDDGSGAAMVSDLGDKVVPFPREFHVKLWQEMIHVWGIDAAVLFTPGSGQSLLAFVLERKHAVAVVKNAQHKKFIKENLAQAVKSLGLAPDRRPAKPAHVAAWESRRAVGGAPPPPNTTNPGKAANAPPSIMTMATPGALPAPPKAMPPAVPPAPGFALPAAPAAPGAQAATGLPPALAAFGSSALL